MMHLDFFLFYSVQIISLGAGFDSSYFRLKDKGALSNTRFLEVSNVLRII